MGEAELIKQSKMSILKAKSLEPEKMAKIKKSADEIQERLNKINQQKKSYKPEEPRKLVNFIETPVSSVIALETIFCPQGVVYHE